MTEIAATNTTTPPPLPYGHDRLVCNVAQSVAAHLVVLYPKDDNNNTSNNKTTTDDDDDDDDDDDFLLQECHRLFQDEIQNVIQERFHSSSSSQINPDVVMSLAFEKAIQIYKEKRKQRSNQSTKPNKSSFSLFGNNTNNSSGGGGASGSSLSLLLAGGGGGGSFLLGSIITWERVQEECNTELEKIKMLQTVKYLEDIFPDWKDFVRPFLQGLMIAQTKTKHSNDNNNNNNDDELIDRLIQLHRSWFRLARSGGSDESYHSFQFDLVENLMQMIDNKNNNNNNNNNSPVVQEENSSSAMQIEDDNHNHHNNNHDRKQHQSTQRIISTIVDMFSDWVERNELSIMTNHSERLVTVGTFLLQQSNMVVQYDPQAIWFHQWMLIMSCDQTTNVVLRSSSTTTIIISKHLASLLLLLPQQQDELSITTTINNNNNHDNITISPLAIYTLSIVRSILISTRVSRFPWTVLMTVEPNHDNNNATQGPLDLIRLYIIVMETILFPSSSSLKHDDSQAVNSTSDNAQQATIDMCLEAIDTLLWGCCCQNNHDDDDSSSSFPFPNMLHATEQLLLKTNNTKNSALVLYTQQQLQTILHRIKQQ